MNRPAVHAGLSPQRIAAMILRYWYVLMSSWPRLLELLYWPALQIVTWGFLQNYISQNAGFFARAGGTLVGAVILWDILFRGQLGFSISFLEEMWARNLGNLMMSPLKPIEFLLALMAMSLIRLAIGVIPMTLLAIIFFGFNVYSIGFPLIAFFCNLIFTSWSVGILRLRTGAAPWSRRREHRLDADVRHDASRLHLLSGNGAAVLAATCRLGAATDLRVRRHAGIANRACISRRSDDGGARDQCRPDCGIVCSVSGASAQRAATRIVDPDRRIVRLNPGF